MDNGSVVSITNVIPLVQLQEDSGPPSSSVVEEESRLEQKVTSLI